MRARDRKSFLARPGLLIVLPLVAGIGACREWAGGAGTAAAGRDPADPHWVLVQGPVGAASGESASSAERTGSEEGEPAAPNSRVVALDGTGSVRVLSEGLAGAGEPAVSPDGRRVLFAGRESPGDASRIYEAGIGGGPRVARTPSSLDALDPVWIAGGGFAFRARERTPAPARAESDPREAWGVEPWSVWVLAGGEKEPFRITYGRASIEGLAALRDGRLLLAVRGGAAGSPRLLAVNTDGTGIARFAEATPGALVLRDPRETSRANVIAVAVGSGGTHWIEEFPMRRPSPRVGLRDPSIRSASPDGTGGLVVAARMAPAGLAEVAAGAGPGEAAETAAGAGKRAAGPRGGGGSGTGGRSTLGIFRVEKDGTRIGAALFDDPDRDDRDAVAVVPHPAPRGRLSLVRPGATWAELLCLDVRESVPPLEGGPVASVRFSEVVPAPGDGGSRVATRRLGVAPVAGDGSFFVRVPPDVPLAVELLDQDGNVVRRTEGSFWLRPGERRGCVGCHEDPLLMPRNHRPLAVQRPPVDLSVAQAAAGRAP